LFVEPSRDVEQGKRADILQQEQKKKKKRHVVMRGKDHARGGRREERGEREMEAALCFGASWKREGRASTEGWEKKNACVFVCFSTEKEKKGG